MKKVIFAFLLWFGLVGPAHPFTGGTGNFDGLVFLSETRIPGPGGTPYALCQTTRDFRLLGLTLTRVKTGFGLSQDACTTSANRSFTTEQLKIAQSLGLIEGDNPFTTSRSGQSRMAAYALWLAVALALLAVIIRRVRSILGLTPGAPLRQKATRRILLAMCHVGKCDGIVAAAELALIGETIRRLTGRTVPVADIIRVVDRIDAPPTPADFIAFGRGLLDHEKDAMILGVLTVAIASGRMFPAEYQFVITLTHGLGVPAEDVRRLVDQAITARTMRQSAC
ncbi:TerB family tellurite resistance protein [Yoonia sp.]|uniref:tellurite resistance TerB family protein n=1 Tax=Yoonia sp. TaxID=2212373 RepID=UPI003919F767